MQNKPATLQFSCSDGETITVEPGAAPLLLTQKVQQVAALSRLVAEDVFQYHNHEMRRTTLELLAEVCDQIQCLLPRAFREITHEK